MRVIASIFACCADVAFSRRIQEARALETDSDGTEVEADGEGFVDPCKLTYSPGRWAFQSLEKDPAGTAFKSKYLPMTAGGSQVIFEQGGGKYKIDTSAVQQGAGIRYRVDTDKEAADPIGQAVEDGDIVSGTETTDEEGQQRWLKVEIKQEAYKARGVAALMLTRSKENNVLEVYPKRQWKAELPGRQPKERSKTELNWSLSPDSGDKVVVDFEKDISFVKRVWNRPEGMDHFDTHDFDPEPATVELHYKNGKVDSFHGGVHYDPKMMKESVLVGSFQKFDAGVQGTWKKKDKMANNDKHLMKTRQACLKQQWCVGFQFDTTASPAMVYYLDSWDGQKSKGGKPMENADLSQWEAYKYYEGNSDGVLLNPKLTLGKYSAWVNKKKASIMQKEANFTQTDPDHFVDRANCRDSIQGDNVIAQAITKVEPPPLNRAEMVKVWAYREFKMLGSESLYATLKCSDSMKTCGEKKDIMVHKNQECPDDSN